MKYSVSTHSRPKAAGSTQTRTITNGNGFNTQPPEGGWGGFSGVYFVKVRFQHTAARRRLATPIVALTFNTLFQHTAARRRLGDIAQITVTDVFVSTHSRPKAAG